MKKLLSLISLLLVLCISLTSCLDMLGGLTGGGPAGGSNESYLLDSIPEFDNKTAYVIINENKPFFTEEELTAESFEKYSPLDSLGRCGAAIASVGQDIMPTEERGSIGSVKPSGWQSVKYDIVDGKYLYNRCHLIGYQLTGENANRENLITGTRFLNIEGMLDFENMIADYVKETGNHVMYRVTPIYEGNNLLASGVLLEAISVEDGGAGIKFCVYSYNAQPGIVIDYKTGLSALSGEPIPEPDENESQTPESDGSDSSDGESGSSSEPTEEYYIVNLSTKKFHKPDCQYAKSIAEKNKLEFYGTRDEITEDGYSACGTCKP